MKEPRRILLEEYEKLKDYLLNRKKSKIEFNDKDVENMTNYEKFPDSAYNYRIWWSGYSHPLSKIWVEDGFKLTELELGEYFTLEKNSF